MNNYVDFSELEGEILSKIVLKGDEEIVFSTESGKEYKMYHDQSCCENVYIEDIDGDLNELLGSEIITAEEVTEEGDGDEYGGSSTWTFYKICNDKTYITIRWLGESNGYYSESVDFIKVK